jgi:hypothetical protein
MLHLAKDWADAMRTGDMACPIYDHMENTHLPPFRHKFIPLPM